MIVNNDELNVLNYTGGNDLLLTLKQLLAASHGKVTLSMRYYYQLLIPLTTTISRFFENKDFLNFFIK